MDIGKQSQGTKNLKVQAHLKLTPNDYPTLMQGYPTHGLILIMTKLGYLLLYEVTTATLLLQKRLTPAVPIAIATNGQFVDNAGEVYQLEFGDVISAVQRIP